MSVLDVKSLIQERINGSDPRYRPLFSDASLDLASSVVHQRYMYMCELRERLGGSTEKVIEYLMNRDKLFTQDESSVNFIHIQTFIPPASNTQFNGLCQLPASRVDLLTGGMNVHPDYAGESDLTGEHIECVPMDAGMEGDEKPEKTRLEFALKRIRIK